MAATLITCPHCQKVLRTNNPPAPGRKVKCPACAQIFVPDLHAQETVVLQKKPDERVAVRSGKVPPLPTERVKERSRRRYDEDDESDDDRRDDDRRDDDYEDERPKRGKKKKKKAKASLLLPLLLLGGGGLVVLLIGGFVVTAFVWPGFLRKNAVKDGNNNPMAFVPAGANLIVGFEVGAVREKPQFQVMLDKLKQQPGMEQADAAVLDAVLKEADRVVIAGHTGGMNAQGDGKIVMSVITRGKVDQEKFKQILGITPAPEIEGHTVYRSRPAKKNQKRDTVTFPGDRLVLIATYPDAEFVPLLNAAKTKAAPAPIVELSRKVDGGTAWLAFMPDEAMRQQMFAGAGNMAQGMPQEMQAPFEAAKRAKGVVFRFDTEPTGMKFQLGLSCANDADAAQIKQAIDKAWEGQGKKALQDAQAMMAGQGGKGPPVQNLFGDVTKSFAMQQDGAFVFASLQISDQTVRDLEQLANQFGGPGMGFPNGPQPIPQQPPIGPRPKMPMRR